MRIWLEKIHLDLKVNWKLSRNQTTFKENYLVFLETPQGVFRSEVAPNIRYGETPESIYFQFETWEKNTDVAGILSIEKLNEALGKTALHHSLRFGIESAFISSLAAREGKSLVDFLSLPPLVPAATSFSMPIIPVGEIEDYLRPISRFQSLKIKVDAQIAEDMLKEISRHTSVKLRVDANEGWKDFDAFMRFEEQIKHMNIELVEQPFPSSMNEEYRELKKTTSFKLLADESIEDVGDFSELAKQFHAVNIKLMKTGSLLKARELLLAAKKHQMEAMMGCMIETTVGISYGMLFNSLVNYVDLDGFLLIKDEPFKLVNEDNGILKIV